MVGHGRPRAGRGPGGVTFKKDSFIEAVATGFVPGASLERSSGMTIASPQRVDAPVASATMRAAVFHGPDDIRVEEVARPRPGPGEAVIRVTLTTICGT